jgi:hypothetical protein
VEEDDIVVPLLIFTADEMMKITVNVVFSEDRISYIWNGDTNAGRFNEYYGVSPPVATTVWEDLQTTAISQAGIPE